MAMWLTVDEMSNYLNVSKETVYRYSRECKIPASKVGRQWRFNKERIDNWLLERAKKKQEKNLS